jgi:hypothetical protein
MEIDFDERGSTEFDVQSALPGVPLETGARMQLMMAKKDPSKLWLFRFCVPELGDWQHLRPALV